MTANEVDHSDPLSEELETANTSSDAANAQEQVVSTTPPEEADGYDSDSSGEFSVDGRPDGEGNNSSNNTGKVSLPTSSTKKKRNRVMSSLLYNWRLYFPRRKTIGNLIRWFIGGDSSDTAEQSDEELKKNLQGLAQCLNLLRVYLDAYGMPEKGGPKDQYKVLGEIASDLYAGGTPMWALESVLKRAAEGLTGHAHVNWHLFPRKSFMFNPTVGTTSMYKMERGFNISKMDAMEPVVLRLCSFASNVEGVSNVPARFPDSQEFKKAARDETERTSERVCLNQQKQSPKKLANKILALSSKKQGIFYFVNSYDYTKKRMQSSGDNDPFVGDFWVVSDEERELFTRLACQEAMEMINSIDEEAEKSDHFFSSPTMQTIFRGCASAGACAFWFGGSFMDMIVAAIIAILISFLGSSPILTRSERVIFEVVASFVAGIAAGGVALTWPDDTCFNAMAVAGILDILQGFRVVYAVIEILSKHTVSGTADLAEGILMTALIAYFLSVGQYFAAAIFDDTNPRFEQCRNGIDELWYLLFVPLAAFSWSGLFNPKKKSLITMTYHGCFAYALVYVLSKYRFTNEVKLFIAAAAVSFSAGVLSRFTGRQALGNTISGIYVLLPGAYLVTGFYGTSGSFDSSFFTDIVTQAVIIGIGGWTGTVLCSPTVLGATRALKLSQKVIPGTLRRQVSKARAFNDDSKKDEQPMRTMFRF